MSKKPKQYKPQKTSGTKAFRIPSWYEDPEWVAYSKRFLIHNPQCYCCPARARAVDHLIAFKKNIDLFWKVDNFIPLCSQHHNTVTANFDKFNPPKTREKLEWLSNMRLINDLCHKVKIVPLKLERKKIFHDDFPEE